MNRKPRPKKWGQTLFSHNQQRFSQHASLLFPFGKLAICYCPCRRYAVKRKVQELGRGPWRVAGHCIRWQLMSLSAQSPCQMVFGLVTLSQRAGIPTPCVEPTDSLGPCSCLPSPHEASVGWSTRKAWSRKARRPLFKFMLAFNCHKGNLLKSLSQVEMKRKHLK